MKSDFAATIGHRFDFRADWGSVHCEVLEVEPSRTLAYTWVAMGLESVVTWTLRPRPRLERVCAWSRRASNRIRNGPTKVPNSAGNNSWPD